MTDTDIAPETTTCPHCREEIRAAAIICKHCKRTVGASTPRPIAHVPPVCVQVVCALTGIGVLIAAFQVAGLPATIWWNAIGISWIPVVLVGAWQFVKTRSVPWLVVLIVAGFVPEALLQHLSESYAIASYALLGTAYGVSSSLRHRGSGQDAATLRSAWIVSACLVPVLFLATA